MFKHKFFLLMTIVMVLAMPLNVFAQSDAILLPEIINQYSVNNDDDKVIYHEVTEFADGSYTESIIELIEETVIKNENSFLRDPGGSGTASQTYRHSISGYNPHSGKTAVAKFDFEIRYKYNTAYPGYSANAMTYVLCSIVEPGFTVREDVGRHENKAWVTYNGLYMHSPETYTYTVSWGVVSVVKS